MPSRINIWDKSINRKKFPAPDIYSILCLSSAVTLNTP